MKQVIRDVLLALFLPCFVMLPCHAAAQVIDLSGNRAFQLDEKKVGGRESWFEKSLTDKIELPGSTDEAGFGTKSMPDPVRLTREHRATSLCLAAGISLKLGRELVWDPVYERFNDDEANKAAQLRNARTVETLTPP